MDAKKYVKSGIRIRAITYTAMIAAALCVISPLTIPIGAVPLSLATFGVMLGAYAAGPYISAVACIIYLIIGAAGLPVFSGFTAGIGRLAGPTGGYLIGYIALALISGAFAGFAKGNRLVELAGLLLGNIALYAIGSVWLALSAKISFGAALAAGVLPFIAGDLLKIAAVMLAGGIIKNRIAKDRRISQDPGRGR